MKVKYTCVLQVWTTVQHKNCERKLASGKVIVFYFEDFSTTACMLLVFMTNRCTSITDPIHLAFQKGYIILSLHTLQWSYMKTTKLVNDQNKLEFNYNFC